MSKPAVNTILLQTYWQIGRHIVEFEQKGYELDENDFSGVSALCRRFTIPLPKEYDRFINSN